ncbi:MAG: hypothetical protein JSS49_07930 [Planctomycetes bacterium]|nr:hypothetical protein [Planctomycetota bacterium]
MKTQYVVKCGNNYLTGFMGRDGWNPSVGLAFPFTDKGAASRQADRINGLKLGNTKATVEPLHDEKSDTDRGRQPRGRSQW